MVQHVLRGLAREWHAPIDIAAASARMDRDADARAAVAELLKLKPGCTVQQWLSLAYGF